MNYWDVNIEIKTIEQLNMFYNIENDLDNSNKEILNNKNEIYKNIKTILI